MGDNFHSPLRNNRIGRRQLLKGVTALGLASIGLMGSPFIDRLLNIPSKSTALADAYFPYYGDAAASWADQYAISSNSNYSQNTQGGDDEAKGDDCTNFASNAMYQGGFLMDDKWYSFIDSNGNWQHGSDGFFPWTVAQDLYTYLQSMNYEMSSWVGPQRGINQTNGLVPGDLIFFSWQNVWQIDHMAIQTYGGLDSNGIPYDQVDAHTEDHLGVFWTLEDFWSDNNLDPNNVTITGIHISQNIATPQYFGTY